MNDVLKRLGKHYEGMTSFKRDDPLAGDEKAFEEFFKKIRKDTAKTRAASSIEL